MVAIGKYELHEQLGKGGFGIVYRATDITLGREVALKVLHPQLMVEEGFVERFKKEARVLASLEHPNIVTIYELGEQEGRVFIAMRYLSGGSLQQKMQNEGALGYEKTLEILKQICAGLQYAHKSGLVHRDVKPANVLFDAEGNAIVSDFGLARAVQLSSASSSLGMAGTPAYRAPELWRGKPAAAPSADIYSLGCMLVEMLTGKPLFAGDTPDEILAQVLIDGPKLPETWKEDVPTGLNEKLAKVLSKEPTERPQDAKAFFQLINATAPTRTVPQKVVDRIEVNEAQVSGGTSPQADEMTLELAEGVSMEFVRVPAGEFGMGSDPKVDRAAQKDEQPQHRVYLDEYWIGKYPVTHLQYRVFLQRTNRESPQNWRRDEFPAEKADHPVVYVSWQDAEAFCKWLSAEVDRKIALPTEAQWEKAARGMDGRIYPWGNQNPDASLANYNSGGTKEVGSYPAGVSPYGALDMAGNVWEWVVDWYGEYYANSPAKNPAGPASGRTRVLRGGAWVSNEANIRSSIRVGDFPSLTYDYLGFRCSLSFSVSS